METLTLTIDGQEVKARRGATVLEAALDAGLYVPTLCYHPFLPNFGGCRICIVDVEGLRGFPPSCTTPATDKMVVRTKTPQLQQLRREVLELTFTEHPRSCIDCWRRKRCGPDDICLRNVEVTERCVTCPKNYKCELQNVADYLGMKNMTLPYTYRKTPILKDNPYFDRNYNLCIMCGRCIRGCCDARKIYAIAFNYRGAEAIPGTAFNRPLNEAGCKFCFTCVEVCPVGALMDKKAVWQTVPEWRDYVIPCQGACPAHVDAPRYVRYATEGKAAEALAVNREKIPFPHTLGLVCVHFCEQGCRRGLYNNPIGIKDIKRWAAENDREEIWRKYSKLAPPTGKKVAIVGAGPSGLTAAYYLQKQGHQSVVFEALPEPGGMMRVGIPEYRLPRHILAKEIDEMRKIGVEIKTNTRIESVDELLKQGFNAVYLAPGAHKGMKLGIPGEDAARVYDCAAFLRDVSLGKKVDVGQRVVVIGGGNAAIDAARVSVRLGVKEVVMAYRRTRAEMPAAEEEVEGALEEGVKIEFLTAPNKVSMADGKVRMEFLRMRLGKSDASGRRSPEPIPGSEYTQDYDTVIAAIGQAPDIPAGFGVKTARGNRIQASEETTETSRPGVYAGGDAVLGPSSVIESIAAGRKAAVSIDKYLGGKGDIDEVLVPREANNPVLGRDEGFADWKRDHLKAIPIEKRVSTFDQVEIGMDIEAAVKEAKRCYCCHLRLDIPKVKAPPVAEAQGRVNGFLVGSVLKG
ncbi:MAG: FAD-dependent oxidoreductase [Chloroflexi bacterium]|nr:FAD-dependent oxidoreductase [Chloroflexota bacterium]